MTMPLLPHFAAFAAFCRFGSVMRRYQDALSMPLLCFYYAFDMPVRSTADTANHGGHSDNLLLLGLILVFVGREKLFFAVSAVVRCVRRGPIPKYSYLLIFTT